MENTREGAPSDRESAFREQLTAAVSAAQGAVLELARLVGVFDEMIRSTSAQESVAPISNGTRSGDPAPAKQKPSPQQLQCFWILRKVGASVSSGYFAPVIRVIENLSFVRTVSGKDLAIPQRVLKYLQNGAARGYVLQRGEDFQLSELGERLLDRRMNELEIVEG